MNEYIKASSPHPWTSLWEAKLCHLVGFRSSCAFPLGAMDTLQTTSTSIGLSYSMDIFFVPLCPRVQIRPLLQLQGESADSLLALPCFGEKRRTCVLRRGIFKSSVRICRIANVSRPNRQCNFIRAGSEMRKVQRQTQPGGLAMGETFPFLSWAALAR